MKRRTLVWLWILPLLVPSLLAATASALPHPGTELPSLRLLDAWDRILELSRFGSKPVLVVYEDKDSAGQNEAFKSDLAVLARGDRYRSSVRLVAIADVQAYDYWPVRGFVKDAIRDESRKFGTVIYCDWDGAAQRTLGLRRGISNVILYGKDAKVVFSHEGPLSAAERQEAIELLRAQVEPIPQR